MGFGIQGLEFGFQSLGFRGWGFGVWDLWLIGFRGWGFGVWDLRLRVWVSKLRV